MAGYTRVDTINNIADGNVINAADLDGEFDGIQAAFNSSTGHNHDGTAGEGAPILALGPVQDVTISTSVLGVKTTNTVDLGTTGLRFKDFYLAGNASIGGTLGVTGNVTLGDASADTVTVNGTTTFNASPIISVTDNTNAALRITQLGTGNALLVEDSTNPDATAFAIDSTGTVLVGNTTAQTIEGITPSYQQLGANNYAAMWLGRYSANNSANFIYLTKSRSATVGTNTIVQSGDDLGTIAFYGADGTNLIQAASILGEVDGTPGTNDMPGRLVFSTTADGASTVTERMRINSTGNLGLGATTLTNTAFRNSVNITGSTTSYAMFVDSQVQSGVTSSAVYFSTSASTAAASFTANNIKHYRAGQATFGAGSTVTSQYGFIAEDNLTGATNNYGFYSDIASGTGRYNFYANGTASNFFGGNTIVSVTDNTNAALRITQLGTGNALLVEDSTNPDSTPFVIDADGKVVSGSTTAVNYGGFTPNIQVNAAGPAQIGLSRFSANTAQNAFTFLKSRGATVGDFTSVASGDNLGTVNFYGADGTTGILAATILSAVDGTPGTNDMPGRLVFSTTADGASSPTERMRIDSAGQTKFSYNAVIETTDNTNAALRITQLGTGNALLVEDSTNPDSTPFVITADGRIVSGATSLYPSPTNTSFTDKFQLNGATNYDSSADFISWSTGTDTGASLNLARSDSGTIGTHTVVGSTDIFGNVRFFGSDGTNFIEGAKISAGADGTPGTNDMPGRLVFSTTADGASTPTERLKIANTGQSTFTIADMTSANPSAVTFSITSKAAQTGTTSSVIATYNTDATYTGAGSIIGFYANQGTFTVAPTNQYGFYYSAGNSGATNNYGFYGNMASGTGRWNFYAGGTADNYFAGDVGIGTTNPVTKLEIAGSNNAGWNVTASISGTTMTVTAITSGVDIAVGDLVYSETVQPYTRVTALGTGTGGIGTYTVSVSQTVSSTAVLGTSLYGSTLIRITDTDTIANSGQPTGGLQFFTADTSTPTAGVSAYVAALAEDTNPDTALVFGTRDDNGVGIDANERMRIDSIGNVGIGTATPTAVLNLKAGTATASTSPLKFTSGTNLTSAEAGSVEYDGNVFYGTADVTSGRGLWPTTQYFRLTADGTAIGPTIANFFGATSGKSLDTSAFYEVEYNLYFTKTTAGTVTFTLTYANAPINCDANYVGTPVGGVGTVGASQTAALVKSTATASALPVTGSLTTAVNHQYTVKAIFQANATTGGTLNLQVTSSAGTVTPLTGSYYKVTRLPAANTGAFA
jgi:predicted NAD-dependent protein-ADP-ribosyltransferase YbiA (DUF1768 family)